MMSHSTFHFTGFYGYARFTEGSFFAMGKWNVCCNQD